MSRYRPLDPAAEAHDPEQGLFWYVIQVSGADVGTVWLEPGSTEGEAILGILLGSESLFGLGIGQRAINMALDEAQSARSLQAVVLNVRQGNARAIACYRKCGFDQVGTGVKQTTAGEIHYLTMRRHL